MASIDSRTIWALTEAMTPQERDERRDHVATVSSIDGDGTTWVQLVGSEGETPINGTIVADASVGQSVMVRIEGGRASIVGNESSPSVGGAYVAGAIAPVSQTANDALEEASRARDAADAAERDAERAHEAADNAQESANVAYEAASNAMGSANDANSSAVNALASLSVVEDVIGVVTWAAEHTSYSLTTDTAIQDGKTYYTRSGSGTEQDPYTYSAVAEPVVGDLATYYEASIDEALASYVTSHLALTDEGLWVTTDPTFTLTTDQAVQPNKAYYALVDGSYVRVENPIAADIATYYERDDGYRVCLSPSGMTVVDGSGGTVATFGESIEFDSDRPQRVGGENAYIEWRDTDNDGIADSLVVVATSITFAGTDISDAFEQRDGAIEAAQEAASVATDAAASALSSAEAANTAIAAQSAYISLDNGTVKIGDTNSSLKLELTNDRLSFQDGNTEVAYATGGEFHAPNMTVDATLNMHNPEALGWWAWIPKANGNLALKWME